MAEALGLEKVSGALVSGVPDGPGADAGIVSGDVILSFDGVEVENTRGLVTIVGNADVGKVVDVIIFRDGKSKTIKVTLGRREAAEKEKIVPTAKVPEKIKETEELGMKLLTINSETRTQLNLPEDLNGVAVLDVTETSDAFEKGIRAGDVIVEVGRTKVTDVNDISDIFENAISSGRKSILLLVQRGNNSRFVGLSLSKE
jgi:serine protease Do